MATHMIQFLRYLLIGFYLFAGSYHFVNPDFYYDLIPDYLPYPKLINYASGVLEILLALGVIFPKTRLIAVNGIILLLLLFIPSHVYFIQIGSCIENGLCVPEWLGWVRLVVIHPLLILWAWVIRKAN
jgi:uncharacterized membrane protein